jgi:predicted dehydrogenase
MAGKLRVGIIGAGGIAQSLHIPAYQSLSDKCEVVAVCDTWEPNARDSAAKHNISKVFTDYQQLLADPDIDAVSVTTPNVFHCQHTVDALKAGKHVLCEKPLAMNGEEARLMCRTARETGKVLQVGLQQRFTGPVQFVRDFIDHGKMGQVYYARAQALRRRGVPTWGVFIDKEKQGGGPLIDIGVHILDITLFLMGYPKPVSASGQTWNLLGTKPGLYNTWGDYDRSKFTVEDLAAGLIRFEDGSVVLLESSFMANIEADVFQAQLFGTEAGCTVKVSGDAPVQIFSETDRQMFNMSPANIPKSEPANIAEVRAFLASILDGAPVAVPGENGLYLNAIFDSLYKSAESGKEEPVNVDF